MVSSCISNVIELRQNKAVILKDCRYVKPANLNKNAIFKDMEHEAAALAQAASLSGNQLMITGSKHLHCPPPDGFIPGKLIFIVKI